MLPADLARCSAGLRAWALRRLAAVQARSGVYQACFDLVTSDDADDDEETELRMETLIWYSAGVFGSGEEFTPEVWVSPRLTEAPVETFR